MVLLSAFITILWLQSGTHLLVLLCASRFVDSPVISEPCPTIRFRCAKQ